MSSHNTTEFSVSGTAEAGSSISLTVTDGTLSLLGVRAELGRLIQKADDVPVAPNRVVLTHGYWARTFEPDQEVVGHI